MLPEGVGFVVGSMLTPLLVRRARPGIVMAPGLALAGVPSQAATAARDTLDGAVAAAGQLPEQLARPCWLPPEMRSPRGCR
jgi:hypothetical protein